jgi:hypothetical protein
MRLSAIVCVAAGHRWSPDPDSFETYPVLRCGRCGRHQGLAAETGRPEGWSERGGRDARASGFQDAKIQRRP